MDRKERNDLFECYFTVDSTDGLDTWRTALRSGARLIAMITSQQTLPTSWVASQSPFPEKDFADATRSEIGDGRGH